MKQDETKDPKTPDLNKLKKREILEIMLAQGKEIDRLRAEIEELERSHKEDTDKLISEHADQVSRLEEEHKAREAELQAALDKKEFDIAKVGSIAEASLKVTDIFKEAEKAAAIYLENIRRRYV